MKQADKDKPALDPEDRSCLGCGEPCVADEDGESLCCGALTISGIRPGATTKEASR